MTIRVSIGECADQTGRVGFIVYSDNLSGMYRGKTQLDGFAAVEEIVSKVFPEATIRKIERESLVFPGSYSVEI